MSEAQWMERWNEQFEQDLYLDASDSSDNECNQADSDYDDHFAFDEQSEDEDDGDYAAFDGSYYLRH